MSTQTQIKVAPGLYLYRDYLIQDTLTVSFSRWEIVNKKNKTMTRTDTLKEAKDLIDFWHNEPVDNAMPYLYDDGGREDAGYKDKTGDCVVRAIAIASGKPYRVIFDRIALGNKEQRKSRLKEKYPVTGKYSVDNGVIVQRKWFKDYMKELGFEWFPLVIVGSGCTVHLCPNELPKDGRYVLSLSKHYTALVDGEIRDIYDPSRGGNRCVYGYWEYIRK